MSEHRVDKGITITYPGGHTEHVACGVWWLGDGVLHTDKVRRRVSYVSYDWVRGPSFPLVNIRKWEETR